MEDSTSAQGSPFRCFTALSVDKFPQYPIYTSLRPFPLILTEKWVLQSHLTLFIPLSVPIPQQKRKLRIYISNTFTPAKEEGEGGERVASWELRVEGKLLEDVRVQQGWREELWSVRSSQEGGREGGAGPWGPSSRGELLLGTLVHEDGSGGINDDGRRSWSMRIIQEG